MLDRLRERADHIVEYGFGDGPISIKATTLLALLDALEAMAGRAAGYLNELHDGMLPKVTAADILAEFIGGDDD